MSTLSSGTFRTSLTNCIARHNAQRVRQTRPDGTPIKPLILKVQPASRERLREITAEKKGLCLTVRLSTKSFPQQPFADPPKKPSDKPETPADKPKPKPRAPPLDIKVDVYCNGEFVGCSFAPYRAQQASNQNELIHRFHGRKVHRVGERPWVLGQSTPYTFGSDHRDVDATNRWRAISEQMSVEANRPDLVPNGKQTELAKYLAALAALDIPQQVVDRQRSLKKQFGIIDVVITLGRGKKYDPSKRYLHEPAHMSISELTANRKRLKRKMHDVPDLLGGSARSVGLGKQLLGVSNKGFQRQTRNSSGTTIPGRRGPVSSSVPATEDDQDHDQPPSGSSHVKRPAVPSSAERDPKRRRIAVTPGPSFQTPDSSVISPTPSFQRTPQAISTGESRLRDRPNRRRARRSQLPGKAYQMEGLTTEQAFQAIGLTPDITARRKPRETMAGGNAQTTLSEANLTHAHPSPARTLPTAKSSVETPIQDVSRLPEDSPLSDTETPSPPGLSSVKPSATVAKENLPTPSRPRARGAPGHEMSDWTPGAVHKNSVLSYDGNKLRQVRSNRSGWFEESSIMFGARYVVF